MRVDNQVYAWLEAQAAPFGTPNGTLRGIAGLPMRRFRDKKSVKETK